MLRVRVRLRVFVIDFTRSCAHALAHLDELSQLFPLAPPNLRKHLLLVFADVVDQGDANIVLGRSVLGHPQAVVRGLEEVPQRALLAQAVGRQNELIRAQIRFRLDSFSKHGLLQ